MANILAVGCHHHMAGTKQYCFVTEAQQLRQPDITFRQFKRSLKTFMFGLLGRGTLCLNVKGAK